MGLVDDALAGKVRALARLATHIENDDDLASQALDRLFPMTGRAQTIGVTGPPGAGKSTLVNALVGAMRRSGRTVAIIAVDPSSPLSGGATLGDRIRMLAHHDDPGVFIRSTASRGKSGGLAPTTANLIHLFDATGFDVIIVETVGVGQEEVEIVYYVDSVVLVQVPGLGDGVQALKAGVLEVADFFVVNKADLPGASATAKELRALLTLTVERAGWTPLVVTVSAKDETGIGELMEALERHQAWLRSDGRLERRRREIAGREIGVQVQRLLEQRTGGADRSPATAAIVEEVATRRITPRRAAERMLESWLGAGR